VNDPGTPLEALIEDMEKAARALPRADPAQAEALIAGLNARLAPLAQATTAPPGLAPRARRALAGFSAAVAVLRAHSDARLAALMGAARPPSGYEGDGRPAHRFDPTVSGSA
jgi:ABC-type Fe3+-hydroxamate transport system substrate-binding protein